LWQSVIIIITGIKEYIFNAWASLKLLKALATEMDGQVSHPA
jgi:hypothetical protein